MSTEDDDLRDWLRLLLTPGVGRETARRLLRRFGSPQALFGADADVLRAQAGSWAAALQAMPEGLETHLAATRRWLAADARHQVLTLGHPAYPRLLLETADPPLLLFAQGQLSLLDRPAIAIVG